MQNQTRKTLWLPSVCVIAAGLAVPGVAEAQSGDRDWQVKFDLAFVDPSSSGATTEVGIGGVNVEFDTKTGVGLRIENRFRERLGVEFGFLATGSYDATVGDLSDGFGVQTGVSGFTPVTLGLNYHLTPSEALDIYAGAFAAYVRYGDSDVRTGTGGVVISETVDDDVGWGVILGLDWPVQSSRWSLQASLRYIDTTMAGDAGGEPFESDFDPVIVSIGFAYRF